MAPTVRVIADRAAREADYPRVSSHYHAPLVPALWALLGIGCNSAFGIHKEKPRPICADTLMIDDMEDGEGSICESEGRNGFWWTDSDSTSEHLTPGKNVSFEPTRIEDGSRGTSRYAARFSGIDFTEWGAVMGLVLNQQGSGRAPFPATNMNGVKFWMRSDVPNELLLAPRCLSRARRLRSCATCGGARATTFGRSGWEG